MRTLVAKDENVDRMTGSGSHSRKLEEEEPRRQKKFWTRNSPDKGMHVLQTESSSQQMHIGSADQKRSCSQKQALHQMLENWTLQQTMQSRAMPEMSRATPHIPLL